MTAAAIIVAIVASLILVNALYVAAEFGAVSARRSRIQALANQKNWFATLLLPVVQNAAALDRYVATCQIGITLSSLVLGAYGQARLAVVLAPPLAEWGRLQPLVAESTAAVLVLIVLTALQVVFGELVPKSLALQKPTVTALYTVVPMRWSMSVFRWFVAVLNGSGVLLLRWIGMSAEGHRHVHSPEEIELLIAESRDGGLLEPDEQRRLHQALRLGLRTARQLMVPRTSIVAVDSTWTEEQILAAILDTPFSRLPVYEGSLDRLTGVLHTRDFVLDYLHHRRSDRLRDLVRPAATVPEMMPADKLLRSLRDQRTHQALVIDEHGDVAGLVTLEDVLTELIGHVGDEFLAGPVQPELLPDGRLRLPGQLPLGEARRWLGTAWQSEADTLAGYLMQVVGRLPLEGERFTIDGIQIEVERLQGRVPGTLLIRPRGGRREPPRG
jgi:CBS domain containing-hemolysin-like protein